MAAVYFFYDDNDPAMIVIFPLFTLIISIPCLILFGTPTYLILKRIKRASLGAMIIIGMIGSTIIMSSITQENSWVFILISASLGLFYAASYWWGAEKLGKENKANEQ